VTTHSHDGFRENVRTGGEVDADMAVASLAEDVAGTECDPLPSPKDVAAIRRFEGKENLEVVFGDVTDYAAVERCVRGVDVVLHVGAVVSPFADEHPELAHRVNVGSIRNIICATFWPPRPDRAPSLLTTTTTSRSIRRNGPHRTTSRRRATAAANSSPRMPPPAMLRRCWTGAAPSGTSSRGAPA
jgi:hypothetical protein